MLITDNIALITDKYCDIPEQYYANPGQYHLIIGNISKYRSLPACREYILSWGLFVRYFFVRNSIEIDLKTKYFQLFGSVFSCKWVYLVNIYCLF